MIIPNGTIRFATKRGGGIDPESGYAREPSTRWGTSYPCQIVPRSKNLLAVTAQGEHHTAESYEVYIPDAVRERGERVRLTWHDGREREFSVVSVEHFRAVCQYRIIV